VHRAVAGFFWSGAGAEGAAVPPAKRAEGGVPYLNFEPAFDAFGILLRFFDPPSAFY
jgi:hypothetical protein